MQDVAYFLPNFFKFIGERLLEGYRGLTFQEFVFVSFISFAVVGLVVYMMFFRKKSFLDKQINTKPLISLGALAILIASALIDIFN